MLTLLRKLFAIRAARRPQAGRKDGVARTARPQLEALEDRQVPTVVYNGGAVLQNVEAQALYIGDQWTANPNLSWFSVRTSPRSDLPCNSGGM